MNKYAYLNDYFKRIIEVLDEKYILKEKIYSQVRSGIRLAANIIHSVHNNDIESARKLLEKLETIKKQIEQSCTTSPELYYSNFLLTLMQEYVEAKTFYNIMTEKNIPDYESLQVTPVAYLLGICDLIGELRRKITDLIKNEKLDQAIRLESLMIYLYDLLKLIEQPDSVVPGYKRKKDVVRSIIERTHSDVANAILIEKFLSKISRSS